MKGKFLKAHEEFLKKGLPAKNGLCTEMSLRRLEYSDAFQLLQPEPADYDEMDKNGLSVAYFGFDESYPFRVNGYQSYYERRCSEYTPLRQNIILLCAAINGEL